MVNNIAALEIKQSVIFEYWLKLTREWTSFTNTEITLAAKFIEAYMRLKTKILDEDILNTFIMSTDIKTEIREGLELDQGRFQNLMTDLRKKEFFVDNKIHKSFIPKIDGDILTLIFKLKIVDG